MTTRTEARATPAGAARENKCPSSKRPVSRVLSPARAGGDHSSGPTVAGELERPTRSHSAGHATPVWSCFGWGFPCPSCHQEGGALLPHRFTLTPNLAAGAVCFLWHFPASHLDWPLASTLPCEARTFLPRPRPSGCYLGDSVAGDHLVVSGGERGVSNRRLAAAQAPSRDHSVGSADGARPSHSQIAGNRAPWNMNRSIIASSPALNSTAVGGVSKSPGWPLSQRRNGVSPVTEM